MKNQYVLYLVCECPYNPTEYGRVIGQTPIREQAFSAVNKHNSTREQLNLSVSAWFVKGVTEDGEKVVFL